MIRSGVGARYVAARLGEVDELGCDGAGIELFGHGRHHALLPRHAFVVVGVGPGASEPQRVVAVEVDVCPRLDPAVDLRPDPSDGYPFPDVEVDSAHGIDELLEPGEVHHGVVVDFQAQGLRDRLLHGGQAGFLARVEVGVFLSQGVDAVEHAFLTAPETIGVELRQWRRGREGGADEIPGQPEHDRASRLGVYGGDVDRVGSDSLPVGCRIHAEQQDVVAAPLGLAVAATGEDIGDVSGGGEGAGEQVGAQTGRHRQGEAGPGQDQAGAAFQVRGPRQAPGVEQQGQPAQENQPHQDPHDHGDRSVEQETDGRSPPEIQPQPGEQRERDEHSPDPQRRPAHPAISRHVLGGSGQEDRQQDEPDGASVPYGGIGGGHGGSMGRRQGLPVVPRADEAVAATITTTNRWGERRGSHRVARPTGITRPVFPGHPHHGCAPRPWDLLQG